MADLTQADIDAAVAKVTADFEKRIEAIDAKKTEALEEAKRAKAELRKVKEISPEDFTALEAERDKLSTDLAEANKLLKATTTERDGLKKTLETETGFTQKLLIQDGLKSALLSSGVKDEDFIDALSTKFAAGASIVVDGDVRKAMIGDKPVADYIKDWAASDAGKKFVTAADNNGGGAPGGKGGGQGAKTITRTAFDALDPVAKMQIAKDRVQVVDAA